MNQPVTPADCLAIAAQAAVTAKSFFRQKIPVDFKSDQSPVTIADKQIEQAVRDTIAQQFPDHGIFGEEMGIVGADRPDMWIVDPIDGTRSFISGFPLFGFLLAHTQNGAANIGIISMPMLDEIYCGCRETGATLNGQPIHCSNVTDLARATIYINEGDKIFTDHPAVFARLMSAGQTRRLSYDCYPHALVAAGHVDVVVDYDLKPYDFMALRPVVEAAGGVMTGWAGEPLIIDYTGPVISAATVDLHQAVMQLVAGE